MLRYLDDWLILGPTRDLVEEEKVHVLLLCQDLGITVNRAKSDLVPSRQQLYFGMVINSVKFKAFSSQDRRNKILSKAAHFLSQEALRARRWRSLLRMLASPEGLLLGSKPRMRSLQIQFHSNWLQRRNSESDTIRLTALCQADLKWWCQDIRLNRGTPLKSEDSSPHGCFDLGVGHHACLSLGGWWMVQG